MQVLFELIVIILTIIHAYIDHRILIKTRWINHPVEITIYSIVMLVLILIFSTGWLIIINSLLVLICRLGFFSLSMNIFNGFKLNYESNTSRGDKLDRTLFGDHIFFARISALIIYLLILIYTIFKF